MPHRSKYSVLLLTALVLLTTRLGLGAIFSSASDITVGSIIGQVNKERSDRNIPTLITNSKLSAAAASKSSDMIARKYFSHVDPDGNYIWDKIVAFGYTPYTILGENLAVDFSDVEGLMSAWINSPTHRANILNANFKDQGVGVAYGNTSNDEFGIAITNAFGSQPSASTPKPAPAPAPSPTPAPKPAPAPAPNPAPKPAPAPAPVQQPKTVVKKGLKISILNSESVIHTSSLTLLGKTEPHTEIEISCLNHEELKSGNIKSDALGNFVYTYRNLTSGEYKFVASGIADGEKIYTPVYTVRVEYSPPLVDVASIQINAALENDLLVLTITGNVSPETTSVTATLLGQTTEFEVKDGKVLGTVSLSEYLDIHKGTIVLTSSDIYGNQNDFPVALNNLELPNSQEQPLQKAASTVARPDLYNVFKYIVIGFGTLFVLFLITDGLIIRRKKIAHPDWVGSGSSVVLLFIMLSTFMLVNWWH